MRKFRRGLFASRLPVRPDDALPVLEVEEAERLRALVRVEFGGRGREVAVFADHVTDDAGHEFGLANLAEQIAGRSEREWAPIVAEHVDRVLEPAETFEGLSPDDLREALRVQLVASSTVSDPARFASVVPLPGDLSALLALDLPDTVAAVAADRLGHLGTAEEVGAWALGRLWSLAGYSNLETQVYGEGAVSVRRVYSDSYFTASLALVLERLVQRFEKRQLGPDGALVAVPHRHLVVYRVLDGTGGTELLSLLLRTAIDERSEAAGGISPNVYWVRGATWTPVTRIGADGVPEVEVSPELAVAVGLEAPLGLGLAE